LLQYYTQMKHLLIILSIFASITVLGQVSVTIKPADTTACYGDSIIFTTLVTGAGGAAIAYRWQWNFIDIAGAADSVYKILRVKGSSAGIYRCIVTAGGMTDTSNQALLKMHPKMNIDTLYRYNSLGCIKDCKGQFKVLVSGGTRSKIYPPYTYNWNGGFSQDTLVFGLCHGRSHLLVTDSVQCTIDTAYFVDVLKSPKIDFDILPKDTVIYLTNPNIQVVFPDSMKKHLTNWTWDFGDTTKVTNLNPAGHTYKRTGLFIVSLNFTDLNGCDTTITHQLKVNVVELQIGNVLTPNGDKKNDSFQVQIMGLPLKDFRDAYLSNELIVFNRWGKKVFNKTNFKSEEWDCSNLSDGTYFYILQCKGQYGDDLFKGSVTILRDK